MQTLLQHAERVVREAGDLAKDMIQRSTVQHRYKEHGEIVTEADLLVERHIISSLTALYPDFGFRSEEEGELHTEDAEYVWILDPIDGTRYYAKGNPLYSVSLALEQHGALVLGVVFCPEFEQMYCAYAGGGATLNGWRIHVSELECLEEALVCLEIPSKDSRPEELAWALDKLPVLIHGAQRIRILGVSAMGLCLCAMGGFDAWVSLNSAWKEHDVAAGQVIVKEAGGQFRTFGRRIVAGPAVLCEKVVALLDLQEAVD